MLLLLCAVWAFELAHSIWQAACVWRHASVKVYIAMLDDLWFVYCREHLRY